MYETKNIMVTTLLVGSLDALAAIIQFLFHGGTDVLIIFRFIASGIFDEEAFDQGYGMVIYGIFFHYLIALIWVIIFFKLYPKIIKVPLPKFLVGVMYGIVIWGVMHTVVVPISRVAPPSNNWVQNMVSALILVVFVGIPIVLRYSKINPNLFKSNSRGNHGC